MRLKLLSGGSHIIDDNLHALATILADFYANISDDEARNVMHGHFCRLYTQFIKENNDKEEARQLINSFMVKYELKLGSSLEAVKAVVSDEQVANQLVDAFQSKDAMKSLLRLRDSYIETNWNEVELVALSKKLRNNKINSQLIQLKVLVLNLNKILANRSSPNAEERIDVLLSKLNYFKFNFDVATLSKIVKYFLYVKANLGEAHQVLNQMLDKVLNEDKKQINTFFNEPVVRIEVLTKALFEIIDVYVQTTNHHCEGNIKPEVDKLIETIDKLSRVLKIDNNYDFSEECKEDFKRLLKSLVEAKATDGQKFLQALLNANFFDRMSSDAFKVNAYQTYLNCLLDKGNSVEALEVYKSMRSDNNRIKNWLHFSLLDKFLQEENLKLVQELSNFYAQVERSLDITFMNDLYARLIANGFIEMAQNLRTNEDSFKLTPKRIFRNFYHYFANGKFYCMRKMLDYLKQNHAEEMADCVNDFDFFLLRAFKNDSQQLQAIVDNSQLNELNKDYAKYLIEGNKTDHIEAKFKKHANQLFDSYFNKKPKQNSVKMEKKVENEGTKDASPETQPLKMFDELMQAVNQAAGDDSIQKVRELILNEALKGNYKLIQKLSQQPQMHKFDYLRFELALAYFSSNNSEKLLKLIENDPNSLLYFFPQTKAKKAESSELSKQILTSLSSSPENALRLYECLKGKLTNSERSLKVAKMLSRFLWKHKFNDQFKELFTKFSLYEDFSFLDEIKFSDFDKTKFEGIYLLLDVVGDKNKLAKSILCSNIVSKITQTEPVKEILEEKIKEIDEKYGIPYEKLQHRARYFADLILKSS